MVLVSLIGKNGEAPFSGGGGLSPQTFVKENISLSSIKLCCSKVQEQIFKCHQASHFATELLKWKYEYNTYQITSAKVFDTLSEKLRVK